MLSFPTFPPFLFYFLKKDFCESNGASLPSLLSLPFKLVLVYERYLEKLLEIDSLPNQKQRNQQRNVHYPKIMNTLQTVSTVSHKLRALAEFLSWEEKIETMERTILLLPVYPPLSSLILSFLNLQKKIEIQFLE